MVKEGEWEEGMPTHKIILFSCFGRLSNTGITSALACLEVVKEPGLKKVATGSSPPASLGVKPVIGKVKAAKKIIIVDGCPFECSRKTVEASGFKISKSIVLVRDIGRGLGVDISQEDINKAKELIIKVIHGRISIYAHEPLKNLPFHRRLKNEKNYFRN